MGFFVMRLAGSLDGKYKGSAVRRIGILLNGRFCNESGWLIGYGFVKALQLGVGGLILH
jgi:hypothetical protein